MSEGDGNSGSAPQEFRFKALGQSATAMEWGADPRLFRPVT